MSTGQRTPRGDGPEQRWRRTVARRGRPAKLKLGRLVRDFGYGELDREAGETIEARLATVGLAVDPPLNAVGVDEVVTLYALEEPRSAKGPATDPQQPRDVADGHAADEEIASAGPADGSPATDGEPALSELVHLGSERQSSVQPAETQQQPAMSPGESPLVRAARDTESAMRDAQERTRQEAERQIAAVKGELVAARADAGRLRVQQSSLEAQLAGARVDVERLHAEQTSLKQDLTASRSETDGLRSELAQLELRHLALAEAERVAQREIEMQRAALARRPPRGPAPRPHRR